MLVTSLWRHIEQDFLIRGVVIQLINQIGQKTANQFKIKCTSGTSCSICTALGNCLPQMCHKIWVIPFFYGSEPTKKRLNRCSNWQFDVERDVTAGYHFITSSIGISNSSIKAANLADSSLNWWYSINNVRLVSRTCSLDGDFINS